MLEKNLGDRYALIEIPVTSALSSKARMELSKRSTVVALTSHIRSVCKSVGSQEGRVESSSTGGGSSAFL